MEEKLYIYSGIRLTTGCRLKVEDFHLDEGEATIRIHEKGNRHRTIGLNPVAAQAIEEYIHRAGLTSGLRFAPAVLLAPGISRNARWGK